MAEARINVNVENLPKVVTQIQRLIDENARLAAALDRVRALHTPWHWNNYRPGMQTRLEGVHPTGGPTRCSHNHCRADWPCPTIRALDDGRAVTS